MANKRMSIREMIHYTGNARGSPVRLREVLGLERGNLRLRARDFSFSILTYNMALIVLPVSYKGTNRRGAISELTKRIKAESPDIVGLCEVFADGERDQIRSELAHIYSYYQEGPDEADVESDGGLLILSKHPILAHHESIYRQCAGGDCWANKGVIHLRVHPAQAPTACDIFFSHTQNIEEDGGKEALYAQLSHLGQFIQAHTDFHTPTIIMGDLNIPAEVETHYKQLISRLIRPVDLWATKYPQVSGATNTTDNNFYADRGDAPSQNQRLDYILMRAGLQFIPIPKNIEILKWTQADRQISDHFGLCAQFEQLLEIEVGISGTISQITVVITGFRCIETTNGPGSDEVSFSIEVTDQHGRSATTETTIIEEVDTGEYHQIRNMPLAIVRGDPGNHIKIDVQGTEHDTFSSSGLGTKSIIISRMDLLINQGVSFYRSMPYLTDDGEYGVDIQISVM